MATTRRNAITIRRASQNDAGAISALLDQLGYQVSPRESGERIGAVVDQPDHCVLIAELGQSVAGLIHAYIRSTLRVGQSVEIDCLVCDEKHRGIGVAGALLADLEDWSRRRQISAITLSTNVRRAETHEYYRNRGFTEVKRSVVFQRSLNWPD